MYYEARMHTRRPVESAKAAAALILEGKDAADWLHDYDCLTWKAPDGRTLAAVADGHINSMWGEVAVIDLDNRQQIESITAAWCVGRQLIEHFETCNTTEFRMGKPGGAIVPISGETANIKADFECGCCGEWFESTHEEQRRFDQDAGFGICPSCARSRY